MLKQTSFPAPVLPTPGILKYEPAVLPNRYHYVVWNDRISHLNDTTIRIYTIFGMPYGDQLVPNDSVTKSILATIFNLRAFCGMRCHNTISTFNVWDPVYDIIFNIADDLFAVDSVVSTLYNVEYLVNPIRFMEFYDIILDYMRKSSSVPNSLIPALVLPQSLAVYNPYLNIFANDNVYNQTQSTGFGILYGIHNVARQMFEDGISVITNGLGLILEQYNQH